MLSGGEKSLGWDDALLEGHVAGTGFEVAFAVENDESMYPGDHKAGRDRSIR